MLTQRGRFQAGFGDRGSRSGGFTLTELLIALVLMGIVSTAIYSLLVNNQRLYRQQTQRVELNDNIRSAMAILPSDLRELETGDPAGSDILEISTSSIKYKAMRSLYFVCQPQPAGTPVNAGELVLDATLFGLRQLDPDLDSLLVFSDRDPMLSTDDRWLHLNVTQVQSGNACPNNTPSLRVSVNPSINATDGVYAGSPVRGFELVEVRSYQDVSGADWLGLERYSKLSGWSTIQPVVGPLAPNGFRLAYYGVDGLPTADPAQVARVAITVVGQTPEPVRLTNGTMGYVTDSLVTQVAVRNR